MTQQIVLSTEVSTIKMSQWARRLLDRMCVKTIGDLVQFTAKQISGYKGAGDITLAELERILIEGGFALKTAPEDQKVKAVRMPASVARTSFSELLKRVQYRKERIIVTQNGKPRAVFVPLDVLKRLEEFEAKPNNIREAVEKGKEKSSSV